MITYEKIPRERRKNMPWLVNKGAVGWMPESIHPEQKRLLSIIPTAWCWPKLYVTGTPQDDEVIVFLQNIGQPFQLMNPNDVNKEERTTYDISTNEPSFFSPDLTTQALSGLNDIRAQFEYEADWRQRFHHDLLFTVPRICLTERSPQCH